MHIFYIQFVQFPVATMILSRPIILAFAYNKWMRVPTNHICISNFLFLITKIIDDHTS